MVSKTEFVLVRGVSNDFINGCSVYVCNLKQLLKWPVLPVVASVVTQLTR